MATEEEFAEAIWQRIRARQEAQLKEQNERLEKTLAKMADATSYMQRVAGYPQETTSAPVDTPAREIGGANDGPSNQSANASIPV